MKKALIYMSLCLCAGGLSVTGPVSAKNNTNCKDADVVLSKKYPNFDVSEHHCAYNKDGECDPDYSNIEDDPVNGLVIQGTNRKNIIYGSSGPDIICGGNGKDEIWGGEGDDEIYGDNGKDFLYGGLGNDALYGGKGKDELFGYDEENDGLTEVLGEDDDDLYGDNGKDTLRGGPGDDFLSGGRGKDNLDGGYGDDDVNGDKGKDNCLDNDDNLEVNECEATDLEDNK